MKFVDSFRRAGRSLRNAKGRTILTSLAIAVGAFTLTASMAVGEGARQYGESLIGDNINPDSLFIVADDSLFTGGAQEQGLREYNPNLGEYSGLTLELMSDDDIEKLKDRGDLKNITPTYELNMQYMTFEGSDKEFVSSLMAHDSTINMEISAGESPKKNKDLATDEAIIPESFVEMLIDEGVAKNKKDLIGKEITLATPSMPGAPVEENTQVVADGQSAEIPMNFNTDSYVRKVKLTIAAVAAESSTAMSGGNALLVSNEQARQIAEASTYGTPAYKKYLGVYALATGGKTPQEVKESLEKDGFTAQTAEDLQQLLFTIVNVLQGIVGGFGVLALIASVFGIINTQYISVLERTQQIGLMKALGMRGRHVSRLFQLEAAWIGLLGGVIGSVLAIVIGTLINPAASEAIGFGEGNSLLIFQPIPILILLAVLILIAMLAGYFPAKKAAKLDPIEALRTE